jgi:hypothetical protein
MTKGQLLETIANYFVAKGKYLNMREYKQQPDFPVSPNLVLRAYGSWGRLPSKIKKYYPDIAAKIGAPVVAPKPALKKAKVAEPENEQSSES